MAKGGVTKRSTWDQAVAELQELKSRYRLYRRSGSPKIQVREFQDGKILKQWSSQLYCVDSDEDIEALASLCKRAHALGRWEDLTSADGLTWEQLADFTMQDVIKRIARQASRSNVTGHLKEIAKFNGSVSGEKLERWARNRDPVLKPGAFRNRIETISHIHRTNLIDLADVVSRLKDLRPKGAAQKELQRQTLEVKAIPSDEALEEYLDSLDGHLQWLLALISTYGLRPSEAWHAEGIDEDNWIVIPGEGLTKTVRHIAPPVPAAWVERYQLKQNFERYQDEVNKRWQIKWVDRGGLRIPTNNTAVSNCLWTEMQRKELQLWVDEEWVRPYDLRHSYAIRCFTNEETLNANEEEVSRWMGHGVEVHKRTYLRFMTNERKDAALKRRHKLFKTQPAQQEESPAVVAELPADVLEKLAKYEKLKALIDA